MTHNSVEPEQDFAQNTLALLQEFHTRLLDNSDYPYNTLGLAEWLEFEKLKTIKVTGQLATDPQQVTEPIEIAPNAPQPNTEQLDVTVTKWLEAAYARGQLSGLDNKRPMINDLRQETIKALLSWNKATVEQSMIEYQSELLKDYEADVAKRVKATVMQTYETIMQVAGEYRGTGELADFVNVDDLGRVSLERIALLKEQKHD